MEPLDSEDYMPRAPRPAAPGSRVSVLLIFPILGFLLMLAFIGAAVFQWNLSDLIDSMIGLFILLFAAFIALMFWALAPQPGRN